MSPIYLSTCQNAHYTSLSKTKTGVVEYHRACDNSERIGKNLFLIGDNVTMIVFREYIAINLKIVCAIKTDIFDCRNVNLKKKMKSGSPGLTVESVRAFSVCSLT